jgi:hypothetical protein
MPTQSWAASRPCRAGQLQALLKPKELADREPDTCPGFAMLGGESAPVRQRNTDFNGKAANTLDAVAGTANRVAEASVNPVMRCSY